MSAADALADLRAALVGHRATDGRLAGNSVSVYNATPAMTRYTYPHTIEMAGSQDGSVCPGNPSSRPPVTWPSQQSSWASTPSVTSGLVTRQAWVSPGEAGGPDRHR
jgi:hypothetical protein